MWELLLALTAGILTIAAPCIILPLPILLGASVGRSSKARPFFITLGFVVTFAVLGISLNLLVQHFSFNPGLLRDGAAVLLALFGIFMIWPTPWERLSAHASGLIGWAGRRGQNAGSGNLGGFFLGLLIGIVWAPCAGPVLGTILTLVAQNSDLGRAASLLTAYAIGAGLPMLAVAYGGQALTTRIKGLAKHSVRLQQVFGIIIILVAAAVYFQYDTYLEAKLLTFWPAPGTTASAPASVTLGNYGPAPELAGLTGWLNSPPLTIASLKGKVVLVDFWTYSCINCIRTLPYTTKLYQDYKDKGLVVIGVHTPEFAFEKDHDNVAKALQQFGITYPVAQDNDYQTWNAFHNNYWPADYLIDQNGNIVYYHFGEGDYDVMENAVRELLGMAPAATSSAPDLSGIASPEMYFGLNRVANLTPDQKPLAGQADYQLPAGNPALNNFALGGTWVLDGEMATLASATGQIKLHFSSGQAFMVASSLGNGSVLDIKVDGVSQPPVKVGDSKLYTLFSSSDYGEHEMEIDITGAGLEAFTFTFG